MKIQWIRFVDRDTGMRYSAKVIEGCDELKTYVVEAEGGYLSVNASDVESSWEEVMPGKKRKTWLNINPAKNIVERDGAPIERIKLYLDAGAVNLDVDRETAIQIATAILDAAVGGFFRTVEFETEDDE